MRTSEGLTYLYRRRRAFGQDPKQALAGARAYLATHPAEDMRRTDGSFRSYSEWGSYPIFYLTKRGNVLCPKCAASENPEAYWDDAVTHADCNWEDPNLYCDDCGERIESAYAEKEESCDTAV